MPDELTTTKDPLRPMVCSSCGGHFAGRTKNVIHNPIVLCDNCLREKRDA